MKQAKIEQALMNVVMSDAFEQRIGSIVQRAVNAKLDRTVTVEEFDKDLGDKVVRDKEVNVLDFMAGYLPRIEGGFRGCQADAASARNRSTETRNLLAAVIEGRFPEGGLLIEARPDDRPMIGGGETVGSVADDDLEGMIRGG